MRTPNRVLILLALLVPVTLYAQALSVQVRNNEVRVAAPSLRFLVGRALDKLRNGMPVTFDLQLTALEGPQRNSLRHARSRIAISFDLWEERYAAKELTAPRRTVRRLTSASMEAWAIERVTLPAQGLPRDRELIFQLDIRVREPQEETSDGSSLLDLREIVDIFSRPRKAEEQRWSVESRPVRLRDVEK